jgi:hypothetical protein
VFARGSIFFTENFIFEDGTKGKKLLVLLNNAASNDPYLLVKTTSQKHLKPDTLGCVESYHKVYFIRANKTFFEKDTWIQLDDYFPFSQKTITKDLTHIGVLPDKTIKLIINCFLKINKQDLSPKIHSYIVPKIAQGISALANKFNSR